MISSYCTRAASRLVSNRSQACALSTARVPSIKFIGKRSLAAADHHHQPVVAVVAPAAVPAAVPKPSTTATVSKKVVGNGVDMLSLKDGAWYGRPRPSKVDHPFFPSSSSLIHFYTYTAI